MALAQLSIRAGNQAIPVNADPAGSLFTNNGPDTVYYGPDRTTTSATGTSIAAAATATLVGTQYLVVANTLGTLAKVQVTPTYPGNEQDAIVGTSLQVTGNAAVGGTLAATGASTLAGAVNATKASGTGLAVTANETVGGTLAVTGASTLTGAVTAAKASGTGLAVTSDATIGGTVTVTGASTLTGAQTLTGNTAMAGAVTMTKASGTGLAVTANETVGGTLGVTGATTTGGLSLTDATDITIGTSTGSKIGQATSKIGFFNATPVVKAGAYTQTYSTAARTVPAATATNVVTTAATLASYGHTQAQADAIPVAINATQADVLALAKVVNALIDDLQAYGLAS